MTKDDAWTLVDMLVCYFEDREDINNSGGPNKEMQFKTACQQLLEWIEKQP